MTGRAEPWGNNDTEVSAVLTSSTKRQKQREQSQVWRRLRFSSEKMSVKLVHVVMVILMVCLSHSLPLEAGNRHRRDSSDDCKICLAGEFLESCHKCAPCDNGSYTQAENTEHSCHSCFQDCRKDLHLEVIKPCTRTTDVVCQCMKGYVCEKRDLFTKQCSRCEIQKVITHLPSTLVSTSAPSTIPPPSKLQDAFKFCTIVVALMGVLVCIITILYFCRQRKKGCLKQLVKRCSFGNQKEDATTSPQVHQSMQQIHAPEASSCAHTPASSSLDSPTYQPAIAEQSLPPPGNLGPLHIYGAGTVFVSLLNQFSESGGERDEADLRRRAANDLQTSCPASPTLPLSKEEWNRDSGYVSFPSQEQGKECHVSKEEGL